MKHCFIEPPAQLQALFPGALITTTAGVAVVKKGVSRAVHA